MARPRKRRGKIRIKQRALIQKKDKTNVARPDTARYSKTPMPRTNGAVFKVKIKRK